MGIINNKKSGFTLAEVMVVMLVITILLAVFAPFMTKRRNSSANNENLWSWLNRNYSSGPMDIYYNPPIAGGIYIGTTPDSEIEIKSSYFPVSKLVVRSGYVSDNVIQRQLQLRYGRNNFEDPGQLAATFLADGTNLLFGASYNRLTKISDSTYPQQNIAFGYNSLNNIEDNNSYKKSDRNTAFGANALSYNIMGKDNTAFGSGAGSGNNGGNASTFIGYNAGKDSTGSFNTLIGYNANSLIGHYNTFIGAYTGNQNDSSGNETRNYSYNVAVGYKALNSITEGKYNVAVGSGALKSLTTGQYNVALGYNACFGITGQSYKTCIGAYSGPTDDTPVNNDLELPKDDRQLRTYIGANPNIEVNNEGTSNETWKYSGRFGGDAVMEIHNVEGTSNLINSPTIKSNVTTIINGNLIVRGKTFLTMGDILYPFNYNNNVFGADINTPCAENQRATFSFNNSGCETLKPLVTITTTSSDRRLKNIKSKNNNGLEKIKQLKVYSYVFKNDPLKEKHVGVIAQDLQKVFPNSVFKDEEGYLKISTDEIFYAVINSLNQLNKKLESYINKVASLDKNITKMEDENKKLHQQVDELSLHIEKLKQQKH